MLTSLFLRLLVLFLGSWLTRVFLLIYSRRDFVNPFAVVHESNMWILSVEIALSISIIIFSLWSLARLITRKPRYVQRPNPTSGYYLLIDTKTGKVLGRNRGPFKDISLAGKKKAMRYR